MNRGLLLLYGIGLFLGSILHSDEMKRPMSFALHTHCPSVFYEREEGPSSLIVGLRLLSPDGLKEESYTIDFASEQELLERVRDFREIVSNTVGYQRRFHSFFCFLQGNSSLIEMIPSLEKEWEELSELLERMPRDSHKEMVSRKGPFLDRELFFCMQGWGMAGDHIGPKTEEAKPFFDLPIREKDRRVIRELIEGIAETPLLQLALPSEQNRLKRLGDKARAVHPMRFIGFILVDVQMRKQLKEISESSFKWPRFIEGFEEQMKEEAKKVDMLLYAPGFAELLGVELEVVRNLLLKKDYASMVEFFL
jgi:hypothetical protein